MGTHAYNKIYTNSLRTHIHGHTYTIMDAQPQTTDTQNTKSWTRRQIMDAPNINHGRTNSSWTHEHKSWTHTIKDTHPKHVGRCNSWTHKSWTHIQNMLADTNHGQRPTRAMESHTQKSWTHKHKSWTLTFSSPLGTGLRV